VLVLCGEVDTGFIAKTAIFSREQGRMKDVPALLCAVLAGRDTKLLETIFPHVTDKAKFAAELRSDDSFRSDRAKVARQRAKAHGYPMAQRAK
jgi:hypothetical protein